jgi:hypothetical protein
LPFGKSLSKVVAITNPLLSTYERMQLTSFLCRVGLHKWRGYGDQVLIVWKEPGFVPGTLKKMQRYVYAERECTRCGTREKRKLIQNADATWSAIGWQRIEGIKRRVLAFDA